MRSAARKSEQRVPGFLTLVGLAVALFGAVILDHLLVSAGYARTPTRTVVLKWTVTVVLLAIVVYGERRSLASIGIRRPTRRDLGAGIVVTIVGFLTLAVTFAAGPLFGLETESAAPNASGTSAVVVTILVVPLTSGITEEVWFRGYALERIEETTASTALAGIATVAAFVFIHASTYSVAAMLAILPLAIVITLGYLWRRNLFVVIFAHTAINVIGASAAVLG